MRIRHYTPSDFRSVLSLFQRSVHQGCAPYCTPAQLAAWAPAPPNLVKWMTSLASGLTWVAVDDDGQLRGFVQISRDGTLSHLYVDPDHGRCGVGARLLRTALDWAGEERLASVRVVSPLSSHRFFERQGFFLAPDRDGSRRSMPATTMLKSLLTTASAN
ncbi:MAG: GNAT family N-acetyltransferase [Burkholderiaceae bacterium]